MKDCEECANLHSMFCVICNEEKDMFQTKEEKTFLDRMCDLMCGMVEDE